ncbi:MAG: hypothetical protein V2A74_03750 [bacterium]
MPEPYPDDKDALLREVSATIRIRDLGELHKLRDQISVKWWESALILLLFVAATGFVATAGRILIAQESKISLFVLIWFCAMVVALVATLEFILLKLRALRRLQELDSRFLSEVSQRLEAMEKSAAKNEPRSSSLSMSSK